MTAVISQDNLSMPHEYGRTSIIEGMSSKSMSSADCKTKSVSEQIFDGEILGTLENKDIVLSGLCENSELTLLGLQNNKSELLQKEMFILEAMEKSKNEDSRFLISTGYKDIYPILQALRETDSEFLQDPEFMLKALKLAAPAVLNVLKETKSKFLQDPDFMFQALKLAAWVALNTLETTDSEFLQKREFMLEAAKRSGQKTVEVLQAKNPKLLEDSELVLEALKQGIYEGYWEERKKKENWLGRYDMDCGVGFVSPGWVILDALKKSESKLLKDEEFIIAALDTNISVVLAYANKEAKTKKVMMEALDRDVAISLYLQALKREELLCDKEFMFKALDQNREETLEFVKDAIAELIPIWIEERSFSDSDLTMEEKRLLLDLARKSDDKHTINGWMKCLLEASDPDDFSTAKIKFLLHE